MNFKDYKENVLNESSFQDEYEWISAADENEHGKIIRRVHKFGNQEVIGNEKRASKQKDVLKIMLNDFCKRHNVNPANVKYRRVGGYRHWEFSTK